MKTDERLLVSLLKNRGLIWKLACNDFKKRYAGSYLGAVWAMIQPVVTIAMYYVVFDIIMGAGEQAGARATSIPYVLFLTAGLVPWFFFSEALTQGTTSMVEYNYLVKKVVFNVSILPVIKVIAAIFIHAFFVCVMLVMAAIYGFYPSLYTIHILFLLYLYAGAGIKLYYECNNGIFQGYCTDYRNLSPAGHVGYTDSVEYRDHESQGSDDTKH